MTMNWKVVVPDTLVETTTPFIRNLVHNPSAELNSTGWAAYGTSSIARSTSYARRGVYSIESSPTAGTSGLTYTWTLDTGELAGTYYELSCDLLCITGALVVTVKLLDGVTEQFSTTFTAGLDRWARSSYVHQGSLATGGLTVRMTSANGEVLYVDGLQLVRRGTNTSTSYIDGDQPGCGWTGITHGSTSNRDAQYRLGGVEYDLQDQYVTRVRSWAGAGLAPLEHITEERAYLPGEEYQDNRKQTRYLSLVSSITGSTEAVLRTNRTALIRALSPDTTRGAQEFWLAYTGGARKLYGKFRFNQGLNSDVQTNSTAVVYEAAAAIGLRADDPLWYEDDQEVAVLDVSDTMTGNRILRRYLGEWVTVPPSGTTGTNGAVRAMAFSPDGYLYIAGSHTTCSGTTCNRVHYWDGKTNNTMGTGTAGLNNAGRALAVNPAGLVYVGGDFTFLADGVTAMEYLTAYTRSTNTFAAVGTATDGTGPVHAIAVNPINGYVVIGGNFTNWAGVAACDNIAMWNGSAWVGVGSGLNGIVYGLAFDALGNLYGVGAFTADGGAANVRRVFKWNGTAYSELGNGGVSGGDVLCITIGPDGRIYCGGDATTWGGTSINRCAAWSGSAWESLGTGFNDTVSSLVFVPRQKFQNSGTVGDQLVAGGQFTTADGIALNAQSLALWNAGRWVSTDLILTADVAVDVVCMACDPSGTLYIGFTDTNTMTAAGSTTITNSGTASVNPRITIICATADTLYFLENQTTNARLHFNMYVGAGERIEIDTKEGTITSTWKRVNLLNWLRCPGLTNFTLAPGLNTIVAHTSAGTATVVVSWQPAYTSHDLASS